MAYCLDLGGMALHGRASGNAAMDAKNGRAGNIPVLELNANFVAGNGNRACWDFPINEDLSQISGVRLRFRCMNLASARQLNVYLKFGDCWYGAEFAPAKNGEWDDIVIPKSAFMPEGKWQSWKKASCIRIAIWHGADGKCSLQFGMLDFVKSNVPIAILRNAVRDKSSGAGAGYAKKLGECLISGGMYPAIVDEPDCVTQILRRYKLVLLPDAEHTSLQLQNVLMGYLRNGGHLGMFHSMPSLLAEGMGLPSGKFSSTAALGIAVEGVKSNRGQYFRQQSSAIIVVPPTGGVKAVAMWCTANGTATRYPAILEGKKGFWMTHVFLNQDASGAFKMFCDTCEDFCRGVWSSAEKSRLERVKFIVENAHNGNVAQARNKYSEAVAAVQSGKYYQSHNAMDGAMDALSEVSADRSVVIAVNEIRGAWMQNWKGFVDSNWQRTCDKLASCGINAVFPFMVSPYDAGYPSKFVSQRSNEDKLRECVIASHEHGMKCYVWMNCLNCENAPDSFKAKMRAENRLQRTADNKEVNWLCPLQYKNIELLENIVGEICRNYQIDGLEFDMIRYYDSQECFCSICHKSFEKYVRHKVTRWPDDVKAGGKDYHNWQLFRTENIRQLVERLAAAARKARSRITVMASVYAELSSASSGVGQAWNKWLSNGTINYVCPMDYRKSVDMFASDLQRQISVIGGPSKLLPGIGLTVQHLSINELKNQVMAARQAGCPGFVIFEYNGANTPSLK